MFVVQDPKGCCSNWITCSGKIKKEETSEKLSAFAGISQQVFAAGELNKDKEDLEKSNND